MTLLRKQTPGTRLRLNRQQTARVRGHDTVCNLTSMLRYNSQTSRQGSENVTYPETSWEDKTKVITNAGHLFVCAAIISPTSSDTSERSSRVVRCLQLRLRRKKEKKKKYMGTFFVFFSLT